MANKAYKFRIYPNREQKTLFAKTFGCVRFIYNKMLDDKIKYYEKTKKKRNNTPAQYKKEFPWLKEVDSLALANAQMNLQKAYNNFFRDPKVGFPKFKSAKKSRKSYTTNNQKGTITLMDSRYIKLPKVGKVKAKIHRQPEMDWQLKSATVSQNSDGKYYVSETTTGKRNGKDYVTISESLTPNQYTQTLKNGKEYSSLEAAYDAYLKALEQYDSVRQP